MSIAPANHFDPCTVCGKEELFHASALNFTSKEITQWSRPLLYINVILFQVQMLKQFFEWLECIARDQLPYHCKKLASRNKTSTVFTTIYCLGRLTIL